VLSIRGLLPDGEEAEAMESGDRVRSDLDDFSGPHTVRQGGRRGWIPVGISVLLVCGLLLVVAVQRRSAPPFPRQPVQVRAVRRSPSAERLWQARWYRARAIDAANRERYKVLEDPAPVGIRHADTESWRRRLMAQDRTGDVGRALIAAREAIRLARGPGEEYQAREWLTLIACDAGRHEEELAQARRLVAMEPKNVVSWTSLRRAARCNHLLSLEREADAHLRPLLSKANQARLSAPYGPAPDSDE
jgi:hypothetical protein